MSFAISLLRMLTDRGTEYCGHPEHPEYELYLALEDIDHTRTKAQSPQINGICERFHKTILNEGVPRRQAEGDLGFGALMRRGLVRFSLSTYFTAYALRHLAADFDA